MTCVFCKTGVTAPGTTTATFDKDGATVVIQRVPAEICGTCGEPYFDASTTTRLLELAATARHAGARVALTEYVAA